jgi:DNA-binding transcriptional LysR family regulator
MFDDLDLFIKVVDFGNFTKASEFTGLYQSKISRRMSVLEDTFSTQLFKKNVKDMELTDQGKLLYNVFKGNLFDVNIGLDEFRALSGKIAGSLKIILPPLFANKFINAKLPIFIEQYPNIELNISYLVLNEFNLGASKFDLAFSRVQLNKSNYIQKVMFKTKLILCASPEYLNKSSFPFEIEDLPCHKLIMMAFINSDDKFTAFHHSTGKSIHCEHIRPNLVHNSSVAAHDIAMAGSGLTFLLDYSVAEELQSGHLIRVLPEYHFGEVGFHLIKPHVASNKHIDLFEKFLFDNVFINHI